MSQQFIKIVHWLGTPGRGALLETFNPEVDPPTDGIPSPLKKQENK
jgi:hypothetical protein